MKKQRRLASTIKRARHMGKVQSRSVTSCIERNVSASQGSCPTLTRRKSTSVMLNSISIVTCEPYVVVTLFIIKLACVLRVSF